jgi:hypothetical protein
LHTPPGYQWGQWDWTVSPVNAAVVYFGRDDVRESCLHEGLEYLQHNFLEHELSWPAHAVFVEQRLYPMCAARLGIQTECFLQDYQGQQLAGGSANDAFTHLWVYKRKLMRDMAERRRLCRRMASRIARDFPEVGEMLASKMPLAPYRKELSAGVSAVAP